LNHPRSGENDNDGNTSRSQYIAQATRVYSDERIGDFVHLVKPENRQGYGWYLLTRTPTQLVEWLPWICTRCDDNGQHPTTNSPDVVYCTWCNQVV
jgi:hypothetical protein